MARPCENPDCPNDLEGRKANAKCCDAACRARLSEIRQGLRFPKSKVDAFWGGYHRPRGSRALSAHG